MEHIELETPSKALAINFAKLSVNDDFNHSLEASNITVNNGTNGNGNGNGDDLNANVSQSLNESPNNTFHSQIKEKSQNENEFKNSLPNKESPNDSMKSVSIYETCSKISVESDHEISQLETDDFVTDFKHGSEFMEELDVLEKSRALNNDNSNSGLSRRSLYRQFDPLVNESSVLSGDQKNVSMIKITHPQTYPNSAKINDSVYDETDAETTTLIKFTTPIVSKTKVHHNNFSSPSDEFLNNNTVHSNALPSNDVKINEQMIVSLREQELKFQEKLIDKDKVIDQLMKELESCKSHINNLNQLIATFMTMNAELAKNADDLNERNNIEKMQLIEQCHILAKEKDQAIDDGASAEKSFFEIHNRYDKTRSALEACKASEQHYKELYVEAMEKLNESDRMFDRLKAKAEEKLEDANIVIENARKSNETEVIAVRAQLKKADMRINSLMAQLKQKSDENCELTQMVDDLIAKVGN